MIHYGDFDGTRLRASSFSAEVKSYPVGTPLEFTVRKARVRKSKDQNSYLHVLFTIAAKFMNEAGFGDGTPWTKERVKEHCKSEGLYPTDEMLFPGGVVKNVPKSTRDLDKEETMLVIDRVLRHFADEHGIYLPEPGEQLTLAA